MKLNIKRFLKGSLISLTVLGIIGGSMNNNIANARHRRYRIKRYTKRGHWHKYKTGYFTFKGRKAIWHKYRVVKHHKARRFHKIRRAKRAHKYAHQYNAYRVNTRKHRHKRHAKRNTRKSTVKPTNHNNNNAEAKALLRSIEEGEKNLDNTTNEVNNQNDENDDANNTNDSTSFDSFVNMKNKHIAKANEQEAKQETLNDINSDREGLGESDLQEDPKLDQIAQIRAKQVITNPTHYDQANHEYYSDEVENELGYKNAVLSENFASDSSVNSDNNSENGTQAADNINDTMFNEEQGSTSSQDGGHRAAIENPYNTKVGVGVAYSQDNSEYHIVEEFGCNNNLTNVTHDSDSTTQHYGNGGYTTHYNDGGSVHYSGIESV